MGSTNTQVYTSLSLTLVNLLQQVPGFYSVQAVDRNNATSEVKEVKIDDNLESIILDFSIKTNTPEDAKAEGRFAPAQFDFTPTRIRGIRQKIRRN
jgi:hypothetical protein